ETAAAGVHAVVVGAQGNGCNIAVETYRGVEARGDIVVLGLVDNLPIDIGGGTGERHALPRLDQYRIAFVGRDDPGAVSRSPGFPADDTGRVASSGLPDGDVAGPGSQP